MGRLRQSFFALSALSLLLTGCGLQTTATSNPTVAHVSGSVHGGEQPVVNAHIHVMVASSSGYAGAAHALTLVGGAGTDSYGDYMLTGPSGAFDFPATSYVCSTGDPTHPADSVYMLATGGNPGLSNPSTNNQALALVAVLGICPGADFVSTVPTIQINEASTVAAAYALAQFASGPGNIGQATTNSPGSAVGLQNAMLMANAIVPAATGHSSGSFTDPSNSKIAYHYPQTKLNTLANITSACVNTDGSIHGETSPGAGDATACYQFFAAATPPNGGTAPTDTFTALVNIAHNPTNNAASLFQLANGLGAAFQPTAPSQPTDWTLAANAVYLVGNYHFTNIIPGIGQVSLVVGCGVGCDQFSDQSNTDGAFAFDGTGHFLGETTQQTTPPPVGQAQLNNVAGIAVSTQGTIFWGNNNSTAANEGTLSAPDQVSIVQGFGIVSVTDPTLGHFGGVAIDANNNPWIVSNDHGGLVHLSAGTVQPGTSSGNLGLVGDAITKNGHIWVSCTGTSSACEYDTSGTMLHSYTGIPAPVGVAIDGSNHAWFASNDTTNSNYQVFEVNTSDGSIVSGSGYSQAALGQVQNLALDSAGNAWVPSCNAGCPVVTPVVRSPGVHPNDPPSSFPDALFVFAHGGTLVSPTHGFVDDEGSANTDFSQLAVPLFGLKAPVSAGIDQSGNVWVTNASYSTDFPSVTIFIGAASPVVTPIQGNLLAPYSNPASLP